MLESLVDLKEIPVASKAQLLWGLFNTPDPQELFETVRLQKIYGNIYLHNRTLINNIYVLSGAEEIAHVHMNEQNYIKKYSNIVSFKKLLGAGILLNSGEKYVDRRRNILPVFKIAKLHEYVQTMQQVTDYYIDEIIDEIFDQKANNKLVNNQAIIDIEKYVTHICLDIAGLILFGKTWGEDIEAAGAIIKYLNENFMHSPLKLNKTYLINKQSNYLKQIIKKRFINTIDFNKDENLLTYLMNYQGKAQYKYNETELLDEVTTLLITGHETSAIAINFALATLTLDNVFEVEVLEEIKRLPTDRISYESVLNCSHVRMWLEETMRLFPPIWGTMRYNLNHDEINGYYIPAKSFVISNIFALHRNPQYWRKPNIFNPYRFSPENKSKQVKNSYLPFILGARSCVASNFSMIETQVILIRLLQRLVIKKIPGTSLKLAPYLTLRSFPNLHMYVSVNK